MKEACMIHLVAYRWEAHEVNSGEFLAHPELESFIRKILDGKLRKSHSKIEVLDRR